MLRKGMFLTLAALVLAAVVLGACQPVRPLSKLPAGGKPRSVSGDIMYFVPEWGNLGIAMFVNVEEVDPNTHEAKGSFNWRIVSPEAQEGTHSRLVDTEAKCILFGKDVVGGNLADVTIVSQITRRGWGQGEPGEYAFFWIRSTPDGNQAANLAYQADPGSNFSRRTPCRRVTTCDAGRSRRYRLIRPRLVVFTIKS